MKKEYKHIFEPFTVRRMTMKNRIMMTPMGVTSTFMIGSRSTGDPCFIASLNAREPAMWNAISLESTSW